jgi:methyl-accepting chemotaxis protein
MLKNWPIVYKLTATIVFVSLIASVVAGVGMRELDKLGSSLVSVGRKETAAREAMDLRVDIIAISRMTYQLALTPQKAGDFKAEAERRSGEMKTRLPKLRATTDAEELRLLDAVDRALDGYFASIRAMVDGAAANTNDASAVQKGLNASLDAQKAVTDTVKAYSTYTGDKMGAMRADAETSADRAGTVMLFVAVIGILSGLVIALYVSRVGVVLPVNRLTASMRRLAGGDLAVAPGETDRRG